MRERVRERDRKVSEYTHLEQRGERVRTLYTDGTWDLREDVNKTKGNLPLWLIHHCPMSEGLEIQRYDTIIKAPCSLCGERCPTALEGLFNMMRYL